MDARTTVDRVGRGKERQVNRRFLAMAHRDVYEPEFLDLAALNAWLELRRKKF